MMTRNMKMSAYPLVVLLLLMVLVSSCRMGILTELEMHGSPEEKLDIVLVPSHYYGANADSNAQWIADAEAFKNRLLEHHFWSQYRAKINVYRLSASTSDDFHMSGAYWVPDQERVKAFALEEAPFLDYSQNDQVVFIIQSSGYASDPLRNPSITLTRGDPNIAQVETAMLAAFVHEFSHAFGNLGDEYPITISSSWVSPYPNIATVHPGNQCENKWADLMDIVIEAPGTWAENVPEYRTVRCSQSNTDHSAGQAFRPTTGACLMNQINDSYPYCPVCQRQLVTLLERFTPNTTCSVTPGNYRNRASFEEAVGSFTRVNFDTNPDGSAISAHSPGVLIGSRYSSFGLRFTSGVIFGEPNLPFDGVSPPNIISNTGINLAERALVSGYFREPVCAVGITNVGAGAVLRIYDAAFRVVATINSDPDTGTDDFIGIISSSPIHRFEFDFVQGIGFGGDDLLFGISPTP